MARIEPQNNRPPTGKNISVYLNKDLLALVESTGRPPSQLIQEALRKYFIVANRKKAAQKIVSIAQSLGKSDLLAEAISEWQRERENDRW